MPNREFLMLAHNYDPRKNSPCGWFMSEKLDGIRAYWDGGITRGMPVSQIPFANVSKHGRYVTERVATGLWTRYGQVLSAPDLFLESLPVGVPLDGELWSPQGWQFVASTVKKLTGEEHEWGQVSYAAFDIPAYSSVFAEGRINNTNFRKVFDDYILRWVLSRAKGGLYFEQKPFFDTVHTLREMYPVAEEGDPVSWITAHPQTVLEGGRETVDRTVESAMESVLEKGGEGLMIRDPVSFWTPKRTTMLLKMKGVQDMEGTVIGATWGAKTDRGSKLLGLMGSLRLKLDSGIEFDLSGFSDSERVMDLCVGEVEGRGRELAREAGMGLAEMPVDTAKYHNPLFPMGSRVTFRYRELSRDGVPKEARYYRKAVEL